MANRYWVGGGSGGTWGATANTNWSTSSGGSNNASVPGASDFCIFDGNSGSATIALVATTIQGIDFTGFTGTITHGPVNVNINTANTNALKMAAGMTYTASSSASTWTFTNTTGIANITCAGKNFGGITVNGAGGTVQQSDAINITAQSGSTLSVTTGTWDSNSFALAAASFVNSSGSIRTVKLSSVWTIGGNVGAGATIWNQASAGLTFTITSGSIVFVIPTSNAVTTQLVTLGTSTYPGITFNACTFGLTTTISGASTLASLAVGSGNTFWWTINTTYTISGAFTLAGTAAEPISFASTSSANTFTLSVPSGSCTLTWGKLFNSTVTGGATFTATNTLATGTNTGWAITPPADASATGIVTAIWADLLSSSDFSTASSAGALIKALSNLQYTVQAIGRGTVTTGGSTTSIPTSAYSPAPSASVGNQLNGHGVLFDQNTATVALRGQVALILATSASATPTFTVSALTAAPASGDTFSVI